MLIETVQVMSFTVKGFIEMICDRCGDDKCFCNDLRLQWRRSELVSICENCSDKADSFINYYGKKKPKDIESLMMYLTSGRKQKEIFSAMMSAGYY